LKTQKGKTTVKQKAESEKIPGAMPWNGARLAIQNKIMK
jgi:hypothetical protein